MVWFSKVEFWASALICLAQIRSTISHFFLSNGPDLLDEKQQFKSGQYIHVFYSALQK